MPSKPTEGILRQMRGASDLDNFSIAIEATESRFKRGLSMGGISLRLNAAKAHRGHSEASERGINE